MKNTLILAFILISLSTQAQNLTISGLVMGTEDNEPLTGAFIEATNQKSGEKKETLTNEEGRFRLQNLEKGAYNIQISFLGYQNYETVVTINDQQVRLGRIQLQAESVELDEVNVTEKVPQAVQRGDTTAYNASAFKTNPDASAEDLVRKMPGVSMQNGKVQAQGEDVQEVLVDGKPFFGNDPNAALKNLPAEVIQKIEIFDQKSQQAQFSGFDDGETTKTMNIITRPDMRNGQFGNIFGGIGVEDIENWGDERYQAGGIINYFNGDQRLSIIAQSNNINQQNFSTEDLAGILGSSGGGRRGGRGRGRGGRGGGGVSASDFLVNQQTGISQTHAAGLNYSDEWGKKMKFTGSYFFNWNDNVADQFVNQQFISEDADFSRFYQETTTSFSENINHRFNARFDYDIDDNNTLTIRPRLSAQINNGEESTIGSNLGGQRLLSQNNYAFASDLQALSFSNSINYGHRFAKRGRTLYIRLNTDYNENNGESFLLSQNDINVDTAVTDQFSDLQSDGWQLSGSASYSEPIGERSQLQFTYSTSWKEDDSDRETFDFNEGDQAYSDQNASLSNVFTSNYQTQRGGVGYRFRERGGVVLFARLYYQWAKLSNEQVFPSAGQLERTFNNLLPFAMLRYNFTRQKSLRVFYRTNTNPPSVSQLQEVIDNSNPLQLSTGNSDLKQTYQHNLFMRYSATNTQNSTVFFALIGGSYADNYVGNSNTTVSSDTLIAEGVLLQRGGQFIQPVNLDGQYSLRTYLTYGIPVSKIKSNLNLDFSANFQRQPGLVNEVKNFSNNLNIGLGVTLASNISEKVDFRLSSRTNFNDVQNSLSTGQNTQFFNLVNDATITLLFGKGFVFRTSLISNVYEGFSAGLDQNFWLWNANIGKKLFKNDLGEINLSVFDLLKQNTSIRRNVTETYIEDVETQVLQQYVMLTFSYKIRNFGTGKAPEEEEESERFRRWRD